MIEKADALLRVIQISRYRKWLLALCSDGSLWRGRYRKGRWRGWHRMPAIPLPANLPQIDMITREALRLFRNSNEFLRTTDIESPKPAKIGNQLRIRLPNEYTQ